MTVMLLAAGKSTRLGALGAELPKPLVPICGYPVIRFGLEACRRAGLVDVVVNLHHHGDKIRAALGDGAALGVAVRTSEELPEILGTGGGLVKARPLFAPGPVLVMNAKVVADVDLAAVLAAHRASGAVATMVVRDDPDARRWGAIAADAAGRVTGILDARAPGAGGGPVVERMFTGIHVVEPALLDRLPEGVSDVIRDAYVPALSAGDHIGAVVLRGHFGEHSTPGRYLEGNLALLRDPSLLPHPPGPLVGVDAGAAVASGARVSARCRVAAGAVVESGADLDETVVGAGARVAVGVHLRRVVLWPGTVASRDLSDAVVTAAGVVSVF